MDDKEVIIGGDESSDGTEAINPQSSLATDECGPLEPRTAMEFDSINAAKNFYGDYAKHLGFNLKAGISTHSAISCEVIAQEFVCSLENSGKSPAESCGAMIKVELNNQHKWVVIKFVKEHNHALHTPSKSHHRYPLRNRSAFKKSNTVPNQVPEPGSDAANGVKATSKGSSQANSEPNRTKKIVAPTEANHPVKQLLSPDSSARVRSQFATLGNDAQNLLEYFKKMQAENPGFFYAVQLNANNCITNVFWADARSRASYSYFGDAITLDTSRHLSHYLVPFAPFTGVNHHGQTVLFGCAILMDKSEATFTWLLKTFLVAMNNHRPVSIVTNQDVSLQVAISRVLPESRHCISKWHILREGQDKLSYLSHTHSNFQAEFYDCINLTETIEEFESSWHSLLERYDLRTHEWLRSLYSIQTQWVPVYFRNSFFASSFSDKGMEASFFDGYVNNQTSLPIFFRQYEQALENCFEKELEADFDTLSTTPVLKTPSPMEKQAASLYTRKIFARFQEELVETFVYTANRVDTDGLISTFRIAKFEDDSRAYTVSFNHQETKANCSCRMFEYVGILCRHILTVFTVSNILTLPSQYILKRWTRNAKLAHSIDEPSTEPQDQSYLTLRYNKLCREAMRFAEEGATCIETFNTALSALRDGGKKITISKKNFAKTFSGTRHSPSSSQESKKASQSTDAIPSLWPRQDEIGRRQNLNDTGVLPQSVADLNLPQLAPVSLKKDDSPVGTVAVLPCLKSMTWVMENKNSPPGNRVAVINLTLQDYSKTPAKETEIKFQLSKVTLEPMLKSMAYIGDQLLTPANRVAVINLKLQDTEITSGESEVKFQVSKDTLGAMLRSMAYIREQLSNENDSQVEPPSKIRKQTCLSGN